MKYGAHVYLWQDQYDDAALARILDSAVSLELQFVEVAIGDDITFDPRRLAREAASRNLEIVLSPGGAWPMECDISLAGSQSPHPGALWHRQAIDLCAAAGAVAYTGAIYGHPGHVRRGPADPDEPARIAGHLSHLAEHASQHNVQLVLEPMSHFRTHTANTPAQINRLIELTGHENVHSLLDTYHLTTEVCDMSVAFTEMQPKLWGLHACESNRGAPGTGLLPWDRLTSTMAASNWDGYIGFESYNSRWRDGLFARERGMFHDVCPDAEAFIRQSKRFLDDRLASRG